MQGLKNWRSRCHGFESWHCAECLSILGPQWYFATTEQNTFQIDFFAENSLYQIYFSVKNSKKVSKE